MHRWAGTVRPRVITLENVEQILQWSPLVAKLQPRELYACQGFPGSHVIDRGLDAANRPISLSKSAQVRMCGNSVSPPPMHAIVAANHHAGALATRRAA